MGRALETGLVSKGNVDSRRSCDSLITECDFLYDSMIGCSVTLLR